MLNNHSILCQRGSNNSLLVFLTILLFKGCALFESKNVSKKVKCNYGKRPIEVRHLELSAQAKSKQLAYCFKNFLRFEENKRHRFSTCNSLTVSKNGDVHSVFVSSTNRGNPLPKDFKMCMTQELRKMTFKGLQLDQAHQIRFPLVFQTANY